jgi:tripartite-type tricarboxylate transporter receptor subunit TctC
LRLSGGFPQMMRVLLAAVTLAASTLAGAQAYPARPIKIVVPNPPGGGSDLVARIVAEKLTLTTGRQAIVENRAGAAGQVGAEYVARSLPDGYTLLMGTTANLVTGPALYPRLRYKSPDDFAGISLVATTSYVLVTHPSVPVRSVRDLVALVKKNPSRLNYASAGAGGSSHLAGELFNAATGAAMTHIPYKGSAPAAFSVVQGETDLTFANLLPAIPLIKTAHRRPLGVTSLKRSTLLPGLPTLDEGGLRGFDAQQFYSLVTPAGTPRDLIRRLYDDLAREMRTAETRQRLIADGSEVVLSTPEELERLLVSEIRKWTEVIRRARIEGER